MFTGLVETTGIFLKKENTQSGAILSFWAELPNNDLKVGDSIAINGACQTITEITNDKKNWKVYSSFKTLELTNLGELAPNEEVNLERPLLPHSRLGGHFVQGHVDGIGIILKREIKDAGQVFVFQVELVQDLEKYVVTRGSIAVDGISLTVVSISNCILELVLIPETIQKTNAKYWVEKKKVNIEVDILARYVENLYKFR